MEEECQYRKTKQKKMKMGKPQSLARKTQPKQTTKRITKRIKSKSRKCCSANKYTKDRNISDLMIEVSPVQKMITKH